MADEKAASVNSQLISSKTGLRLRVRQLTNQEAGEYQWVALLPYSWTNEIVARQIGHSWQVRAASAAVGAAVSWRWGRWWPGLLCPLLLPAAVQQSLQLLLWLFSTRRLPDYHCFADFWSSGENRLYGAFVDSGESASGAEATTDTPGPQLAGAVASLHIDVDTCEMQRLGVPERWRGRGVGGALCRFLLAECAARGYQRMLLGTSRLQEHAVRIYESAGFTRVSRRRYSLSLPGNPIYTYSIDLLPLAYSE